LKTTLERKHVQTSQPAAGHGSPVAIEYCVPTNCEPVARRLAAAIEKEFGLRPRLIPSRGGVFEVEVGGRLVFSKRATCRFPDDDEVFYHVREMASLV